MSAAKSSSASPSQPPRCTHVTNAVKDQTGVGHRHPTTRRLGAQTRTSPEIPRPSVADLQLPARNKENPSYKPQRRHHDIASSAAQLKLSFYRQIRRERRARRAGPWRDHPLCMAVSSSLRVCRDPADPVPGRRREARCQTHLGRSDPPPSRHHSLSSPSGGP